MDILRNGHGLGGLPCAAEAVHVSPHLHTSRLDTSYCVVLDTYDAEVVLNC